MGKFWILRQETTPEEAEGSSVLMWFASRGGKVHTKEADSKRTSCETDQLEGKEGLRGGLVQGFP